jgi:radical SAM protein with 4Fe4S-binding SPASM domain
VRKSGLKELEYYAKHTSYRRAKNLWKLWSGYHYSRYKKAPHQWGLPLSISIEPTTACNLGCPECPSGLKHFTRPTGNLDTNLLDGILDEIGDTLQYLTFYFQGEPFIHPKMVQLIEKASSRGIFSATSTNAHFISEKVAGQIVESVLNKLIISIDGTTQDVYEQYRKKGKLEKVIEGTRNILEAKKQRNSIFPLVYFQFLVVRPNQHQINDVQKLADELGVDGVLLKTAQVYDYKNGNDLIPTIDKYSRYKKEKDGSWSIKNNLLNQCWRMWHSCVITWDGRIVPCCFDKDATHELGQFGNQSFKEIWWGEAYNNFRQSLLISRSEIDICKNCSEGTKVWA